MDGEGEGLGVGVGAGGAVGGDGDGVVTFDEVAAKADGVRLHAAEGGRVLGEDQ